MNEEWLIDGYNLIHHISSAKNPAHVFPSTPSALFGALAGFAAQRKQKVYAVLDGAANQEELKIYKTAYFEAVYSQKVSADHYIEKYIYENRTKAAFLVVTNDRTITALARGGGARVLQNSEFLEMLKECGQEGEAAMLKEKTRSHGFHRPFDEKFKTKGL